MIKNNLQLKDQSPFFYTGTLKETEKLLENF
jgi:hypothetical protein